jgi:2-polyprenyl-3-methyl-5-hydroxy-6-metoxy-1,4-benzoquinol methylase
MTETPTPRPLLRRAIDKFRIVAVRRNAERATRWLDHAQLRLLIESQGTYQPVLRGGSFQGSDPRDCVERWRVIEPHMPQNAGSAADLGCGQGYFSLRLAERGLVTIGVDSSGPLVDMAWRQARLNGVKGVGFVNASVSPEFVDRMPAVDVVIFFSLMHHLMYLNSVEWCADLLRRLRPKVKQAMFFDMGQSNEPFHEWAALLPDMGSDPAAWIVRFLADNGFTNSEVIGQVPADRNHDASITRAIIRAS